MMIYHFKEYPNMTICMNIYIVLHLYLYLHELCIVSAIIQISCFMLKIDDLFDNLLNLLTIQNQSILYFHLGFNGIIVLVQQ